MELTAHEIRLLINGLNLYRFKLDAEAEELERATEDAPQEISRQFGRWHEKAVDHAKQKRARSAEILDLMHRLYEEKETNDVGED